MNTTLGILRVALILGVGVLGAATSIAAEQPAKGGVTELRATLKANVKTNDFGDVVIGLPSIDGLKNAKEGANIPAEVKMLLVYADPKLDFAKMDKYMSRSLGLKKGEKKTGKTPVSKVLDGVDKYLSTENMNLRALKYSANNVRIKIDEGLPLFVMVYASSAKKEVEARVEDRSSAKNAKEWSIALRKAEVKNFKNDSDHTVDYALIMGYNKETNEYMLFDSGTGKSYWYTEKELKNLTYTMYQLRI